MMTKQFRSLIGMIILLLPMTSSAQCVGSWTAGATLQYLCANGPFLQYDEGVNSCPATAQSSYTFTTPVQSVKLIFSAFGTATNPGESRMSVFLNGENKVDLNLACKIVLGCQNPIGTYSINNGCLVDSLSGADGGISGFIYLIASSFDLADITSIGVSVSEPSATGTIFEVDSCNESFGCSTGITEPAIDTKVIYPNPFTDNLTINSDENETAEFMMYDVSSRVVLTKTFQKTLRLNTEDLEKGFYIYTIRLKDGAIKTGKIIKD